MRAGVLGLILAVGGGAAGCGGGGGTSTPAPICGDGVTAGSEACDDHNTTSGDGCSATCVMESGFTCAGSPSVCSAIDTTPPSVLTSLPPSSATGVLADAQVSIGFSEPMSTGTVAVTLTPSTNLGTPSWSAGNTVVTFNPSAQLVLGTAYTVTVSGQDVAGNSLAATGWGFSTAAAPIPDVWDAAAWDQGTWQ